MAAENTPLMNSSKTKGDTLPSSYSAPPPSAHGDCGAAHSHTHSHHVATGDDAQDTNLYIKMSLHNLQAPVDELCPNTVRG